MLNVQLNLLFLQKKYSQKIDEYYKTDETVGEIHTEFNIGYDWRDELHSEDLSDNHIQKIIRAILKQAILEEVHEVTFQREDEGFTVNFKKMAKFKTKGIFHPF